MDFTFINFEMMKLYSLEFVYSVTVSFSLEDFANQYSISWMVYFGLKCFMSFELIDFMVNFENSNFIDSKFMHFKYFNFAELKVNYSREYFAMVVLISSNFM